jgi:hypothetical protein
MKFPKLKALGFGIELFVAVYVPAFMTTALVRPRIEIAIPLIIGITFCIALILVFLLARRPTGIAEFGFSIPNSRYTVIAGAFGLTFGLAVTSLSRLFPSRPPFDLSGFKPWMIGLYFVIGFSHPGGAYFSRPDSIHTGAAVDDDFLGIRWLAIVCRCIHSRAVLHHPFRSGRSRCDRGNRTWARCR